MLVFPVPVCAVHLIAITKFTTSPIFVYRPFCSVYVPAPAVAAPAIVGVKVPTSSADDCGRIVPPLTLLPRIQFAGIGSVPSAVLSPQASKLLPVTVIPKVAVELTLEKIFV